MRSRGKSTPIAEFLIVVGVLLPVSACTWANPWRTNSPEAKESDDTKDGTTEKKKEMPKVKLSPDEQKIYNRYYTPPGRSLGVSDESRAIEEHLGVN